MSHLIYGKNGWGFNLLSQSLSVPLTVCYFKAIFYHGISGIGGT